MQLGLLICGEAPKVLTDPKPPCFTTEIHPKADNQISEIIRSSIMLTSPGASTAPSVGAARPGVSTAPGHVKPGVSTAPSPANAGGVLIATMSASRRIPTILLIFLIIQSDRK